MAEVHCFDHDDEDDFLVSFSSCNNLHAYPSRISPFDRQNQVNFEIDMFRQPQSQSQSHCVSPVIQESSLVPFDRSFGVQEGNHDIDFDVEFGSRLGFFEGNHHNRNANANDSGFTVAGSGDDLFVSRRTSGLHGARSESGVSSYESGSPDFFLGGVRATDLVSDVDDIIPVNGNTNEDLQWDEVLDVNEDYEVLGVCLRADVGDGDDDDDDHGDDDDVLSGIPPGGEQFQEIQEVFEWQVLSNVHNFEPTPDLADDDYNYTEYEMFFGQFGDTGVSSLGRPPASKSVVANLSTVAVTQEDVKNNTTLCAVCKDEVGVGEMATLLPCSHRYHGDCIGAWLGFRNTCPVCRHELPTDDVDYELRKTARVL